MCLWVTVYLEIITKTDSEEDLNKMPFNILLSTFTKHNM